MSDYINKEEVLSLWHMKLSDKEIYMAIHNMPSANVISIDQANAMIKSYVSHYEENKGEWIDNENGTFTCSKCGEIVCCSGKFCCECGADMRGEE